MAGSGMDSSTAAMSSSIGADAVASKGVVPRGFQFAVPGFT